MGGAFLVNGKSKKNCPVSETNNQAGNIKKGLGEFQIVKKELVQSCEKLQCQRSRMFKIQRKLTDDQSSEMDDENLCTVENKERFKKSYPDIVDEFYSLRKSKSPSKPKIRKVL
ncbi:hypothetical protein TNIN_459991 [Trichonephila inaurata madagascariensis]|uniref:Flap endonuclease GEN chromatin organization modifier domain-containing protein n=1 Tax=Trichonephila inaurata madagascariensis TaxID=2747483 RepID=A0A8X6X804_9ARAC|nr:hypothetical protein TNIN_459991 [Trichonephila inaurata madagascariensis]